MANQIDEYRIGIDDEAVNDLRERLGRARWPDPPTVDDESQGIRLERLRQVVEAWQSHDWRASERRLNALPHYRTAIDGLDVHFMHVRSPHPDARVLLMTHGWPGSFLEFEPAITALTDPVRFGGNAAEALHLVIPSLPGFGFSAAPTESGWGIPRVATAWLELMDRLGYPKFAVHGGDWGAFVATSCAVAAPARVTGVHLTMPIVSPTDDDLAAPTEQEKEILRRREIQMTDGYGYAMEMGTRPQTIGAALVDSPVALAAWLTEKFDANSDTRPEAGGGVPQQALLDNLSLYWFSRTGASTARFYWEAFRSVPMTAEQALADPVSVPSAFTIFPFDPFPTSRRWTERRYTDLRSWREPDRGGHFPALEQPELFVDEVRLAMRTLQQNRGDHD